MPAQAFETELAMLQSMYPDDLIWSSKNTELVYTAQSQSSFTLRVPDSYPGTARPEVILATIHKQDARDQLQSHVNGCELDVPIIDVVIEAFRDMVDQANEPKHANAVETAVEAEQRSTSLTIVVWLHHLLNTSKRKQVISPALAGVSGVSKPGYPGVLVFSGEARAVTQHVEELRVLRWQGFQIRLESAEEWSFQHGSGVLEVESMSDVVAEINEDKKQDLLEAIMRQ